MFLPVVSVAAERRRRGRRGGRGVLLGVAAVLLLLPVTACTSPLHSGARTSASPSAPTPSTKEPVVRVATAGATVSYSAPVQIAVTDGSFTSVQVSAEEGGQSLDGTVSGDGASWMSESPPKPSSSYRVVATVKDVAGQVRTSTTTFAVAPVPDDQRVSFSVTPDDASTVGIGQPVVVRFLTPVTRRAEIQKVMLVDARTASGQAVTGSWRWLNSQEVHWRPQTFWTPGTTVRLQMRIAGVQAAPNRYGRKDYAQTFTIGASHITQVDASTHSVRVFRDGKLMNTWPTGTGRPGLETYSGTYVVLGKSPVVRMDSCSARVTCDKKDPDYYDEKEFWATRITASGTFLHAASWDGLLGRANTSHGCIHLADSNAQDFYNRAVVG
ncbi:MAG TPA: Ig-like domain-containing protein, partial [Kineosporiaceae bacterium]|nr:Ig-like domain-containing protein [Kineosporiaceae bacterium]